jgi:hypothetical protein
VPCGPINDLAGVFADPQVMHRGLRVDLPHAAGGMAPQVANPIRFSATPIGYRQAPPLLGQDTEAILRELGRSDGRHCGRTARGGRGLASQGIRRARPFLAASLSAVANRPSRSYSAAIAFSTGSAVFSFMPGLTRGS